MYIWILILLFVPGILLTIIGALALVPVIVAAARADKRIFMIVGGATLFVLLPLYCWTWSSSSELSILLSNRVDEGALISLLSSVVLGGLSWVALLVLSIALPRTEKRSNGPSAGRKAQRRKMAERRMKSKRTPLE